MTQLLILLWPGPRRALANSVGPNIGTHLGQPVLQAVVGIVVPASDGQCPGVARMKRLMDRLPVLHVAPAGEFMTAR
jgi:hypothetical protein